MSKISRVLLITIITGIIVFSGCASKPVPAALMPQDFIALLDYKQLPSGEVYGSVFVVPNTYQGSVELSAQGKTEKINVKPGAVREFAMPLKLNVGDVLTVKAGDRTQEIKIKYAVPQQAGLGFVDTPSRIFNNKTPFYSTKGKGSFISVYHIAKTAAASSGFPVADTYWFAVTNKNKITIKDTDGMIIVKNKPLDDRKIFYVTTYFYDMDFNCLGGSSAWEAKYMAD